VIKKILVIIIVLSGLLLSGCGNELKQGEVYEKEFKPAYDQLMFIPVVISNGKTCMTILTPYFYHYPDRYVIRIKSFKDNEWLTNEIYVSKNVYDSIVLGSEFEYVEGRDLLNEPYTREKKEKELPTVQR